MPNHTILRGKEVPWTPEDLGSNPKLIDALVRVKEKSSVAPPAEKLQVDVTLLNMERARLQAWELELIAQESELASKQRAIFSKAEEEGLKAGYREGWEQAQKERSTLRSLSESIQSQFKDISIKLSNAVLELAVHAARHVVHESCKLSLEESHKNVRSVIGAMSLKAQNIEIHASEETISAILNHDEGESIKTTYSFVIDDSMESGGFRVVHDSGEIDCSIETRWERAMSQLGAGKWKYDAERGD